MNYVFDFDGTLINNLDIDYTILKNDLKKILNIDTNIIPMYEIINQQPDKVMECYNLIDKYELESLNNIIINKNILNLYLNSNPKIIISRNGNKVISSFFKMNNIIEPDFISSRDNCKKLKPNIEQIEIVINKFPNLKNICIIGDSWHDKKLAENYICSYYHPSFFN